MIKEFNTDKAPEAIGPYSQAVIAKGMIFTSGQIAIDPKSGQITAQTIEEQTNQVLKNLGTILSEAGSNWQNVIKTTIFLADMTDFPVVNKIYGSYFKNHKPARSTVEVSRLPKDVKIEIDCIALADN